MERHSFLALLASAPTLEIFQRTEDEMMTPLTCAHPECGEPITAGDITWFTDAAMNRYPFHRDCAVASVHERYIQPAVEHIARDYERFERGIADSDL